ncbi:hypothetical protein Hanom_Chr12g01142651 [Helianthus anomalus]
MTDVFLSSEVNSYLQERNLIEVDENEIALEVCVTSYPKSPLYIPNHLKLNKINHIITITNPVIRQTGLKLGFFFFNSNFRNIQKSIEKW